MAGIFSKFTEMFSSVNRQGESVLGVDMGTSSIKVVQLAKKRGRAVLETYGELALGPYAGLSVGQAASLSNEKMVEALRDIMREANVTAKVAIFSLPLRSSLLSVIELPAYREEQVNRMVPIEARKYIPVPIGEVTLDWWVIPKHEMRSPEEEGAAVASATSNKTEVLLVAIHKSALQRTTDIASALGLQSRAFEIETFSAIRSVLSRDISAHAVLDVGAGTTKLAIIDYGIVRATHVISRGGQDITVALASASAGAFLDAEKKKRKEGVAAIGNASSILDYIFYEANTVVEEYQKQHARLISKIVCTGGGALIKGFVDIAKKHFQAEVVMGDPFQKVETPAFMSPILAEAGPEFAIALGLALHELENT